MPINIKRVYDEAEESDGMRILVDRIWPRGLSKEDAQLDEWIKAVAPSNELRKWFDHDVDKYDDLKEKYKEELKQNDEQKIALEQLKDWTKECNKNITLVFGAKDKDHNQATVLKEILDHQ